MIEENLVRILGIDNDLKVLKAIRDWRYILKKAPAAVFDSEEIDDEKLDFVMYKLLDYLLELEENTAEDIERQLKPVYNEALNLLGWKDNKDKNE